MRIFEGVAVLTLVGALVGCVALETRDAGLGIVYHLPKSLVEITVTRTTVGGLNPSYTIGVKGKTIPDPTHRYVLQYQPSTHSDDRYCIKRTPTGLLEAVQFASDDKTPEIVFNVARFLAGLGAPGPAPTGVSAQKDKAKEVTTIVFKGVVDPFDRYDTSAFNRGLANKLGRGISIDFDRAIRAARTARGAWPYWSDSDRCPVNSICYRTKQPLPFGLSVNGQALHITYADVVDTTSFGEISIERAFLVEKIDKLGFEDGVLTTAILRKPSEAEELSLLPLNVVNAVLSVPAGLIGQAFGNTADRIRQAEQIAALRANVENLQKSVIAIESGFTPIGLSPEEKKLLALDCVAAGRT